MEDQVQENLQNIQEIDERTSNFNQVMEE